MTAVDAIITAGGTPAPGDPLYLHTQGRPKALLDLGGRPMIQWVLDALGAAESVRRVVVVGLRGDEVPLACGKTLGFVPDQGDMIPNVTAGVNWVLGQDPAARHALIASCDVPTLRPEHVDWIVRTALETDHELCYNIIPRAVMEQRFPGSRRSYFHLQEGMFAGGDVNMLATRVITHIPPRMKALVDARKDAFKQASLVGFDVLLRFALRRMSVAQAEQVCRQRLQIQGRVIICPHAEAGMDVDKPAQYQLMQREFAGR